MTKTTLILASTMLFNCMIGFSQKKKIAGPEELMKKENSNGIQANNDNYKNIALEIWTNAELG